MCPHAKPNDNTSYIQSILNVWGIMGEFGRVGIVRFCMWAHVLVCMSCLDVWILAPWLWILIPFWCMCLTRGLGLLHLVAFSELFLWFLMAWFMWLHFDLGQLLIAPHLVTLTCLLSFLWGLTWLLQRWLAWCSTLFVGYHLEVYSDYLYWLTFFDGSSLRDLWVSYLFNYCYFGSLSVR